jgi:hypothetical protein
MRIEVSSAEGPQNSNVSDMHYLDHRSQETEQNRPKQVAVSLKLDSGVQNTGVERL